MKDVEHPERPAPPPQDPDQRDVPHPGSAMGPTYSGTDGGKQPDGGGKRPDGGPRRSRSGDGDGDGDPTKADGGGPQRPGDPPKGTRSLLTWFMAALLAALIGSSLMLPWKVLGLVFGIAALVLGIVALVRTGRTKLPGLVRVSTIAGLAAALFLVIGTGASVLLWPITETYEDCMGTALTIQAERTCEDGLRNLDGLLTPN
ncbi:hypothetical protein IWX75_001618 [Arthrobacter sp. CAN_A6]|uniref:hypothetical protein n=1 Tax=Arthrobacter sp. CAN_A6 TaxID=2787721 RepID=UPI0018C8F9D1